MSELVRRFVARAEDQRVAVVDARGRHSYATLVRRARGVASAIVAGDDRREHVAVFVETGVDFLAAFYGILLAGRCAIVLTAIHPVAEIRYYCADAEVKTILSSPAMKALTDQLGDCDVRDVATLADHEVKGELPAISPSASATMLYTSGTTGKPKGAILTHENLSVQQQLVGEAWGFRESDILLHTLPLHHMHGLAIALLTAVGAGATVIMDGFDAVRVWQRMREATVFMGVPSMYHRLFAALDAGKVTAEEASAAKELRLATSGSAALPVSIAERWREVTGQIPLERFGMTEIGVGISNPLHGPRHAGHVGHPLPTVETRVVDENGEEAHTGELWIRGPSVFVGYHRRDAETKSAFVPDTEGAPWFRTGDTVARTPELEGNPFKILGRTSVDILKSGGYKLSALEIEEVLRRHDAVDDCAVVGVPDEAWGERVVACVTAHRDVSEEVLRSFVREHLAPYKVPKQVLFFEELPRNALGKVVKPELAKLVASR